MKNTQKVILGLIVLFLGYLDVVAQEDRDLYLWNTINLQVKLSELYDMKISTKTQYLADENKRESTYMDFSLYRKMNGWLRLGAAFRTAQHVKAGADVYEYRPQLITAISLKSKAFRWQTMNRLEHRGFSTGGGYYRYYHNSFAHVPTPARWPKPYLGEELFTKLNADGLHIARLYGGLHVVQRDRFLVDFFYVWQHMKASEEWQESHVLGLNLTFRISPKSGMLHLHGN